jgi:hypothetical protein
MTAARTATELRTAIGDVIPLLREADDGRTTVRPQPGGWCAREVLGHLIDSACNNHRRFVVGQSPDTVRFDGYNQDEWVERQRYADEPWRDLVALWSAYNRHLAHVIESTADDVAARTALGPDGSTPVSIAFLMEDYVEHLRHHLDQIRALLAT